MADLVTGLILVAGLVVFLILAINHSRETRKQMIEEMEEEFREEIWWTTPDWSKEEEEQPEEPTPAPKKSRGRSKKDNG